MMLDATAGNRIMWKHSNYNPPNTVFIDREIKLARPPTIFADFTLLPFRDNIFDCAIFDPPFYTRQNPEKWIFYNPERKLSKYSEDRENPTHIPSHYGCYKSKEELLINITKGQKEIARVAKRLCFRWAEGKISLWNILSCFYSWEEIHRKIWTPRRKTLTDKTPHKKRVNRNAWITFIRRKRRMIRPCYFIEGEECYLSISKRVLCEMIKGGFLDTEKVTWCDKYSQFKENHDMEENVNGV
jgi:hypothetical protein